MWLGVGVGVEKAMRSMPAALPGIGFTPLGCAFWMPRVVLLALASFC